MNDCPYPWMRAISVDELSGLSVFILHVISRGKLSLDLSSVNGKGFLVCGG